MKKVLFAEMRDADPRDKAQAAMGALLLCAIGVILLLAGLLAWLLGPFGPLAQSLFGRWAMTVLLFALLLAAAYLAFDRFQATEAGESAFYWICELEERFAERFEAKAASRKPVPEQPRPA